MKIGRRRFWSLIAVTAIVTSACDALIVGGSAWSQTRFIKLVVPYPPGGLNESMFRVVADYIGRKAAQSS